MTAYIYGELSADESTIIVMAESDQRMTADANAELGHAAALMELLTPKVDVLSGALSLPCSWPAVVQLSATFGQAWRPGPALAEWIAQQISARMAVDSKQAGELANTPPPGFVPRSYQVEGARMIGLLGSALLFDDPGPQPVTTPILTPAGWTTLGALNAGDTVFGADGKPHRIRQIKRFADGHAVYRVTFSDRTSTLATAEHRWHVYTKNERHKDRGNGRVLNTALLAESGLHGPNGRESWAAKFYLPQQPVVEGLGESHDLPLDPYAYGALLGDGALSGDDLSITCPDDEILTVVEFAADIIGTTSRRNNRPTDRCMSTSFHRNGKLRVALDALGALVLSGDKHVHPSYLMADTRTRRAVLAGLLDTDGTVIKTGAAVEFSSASPQLSRDVAFLARTLGAVVTESEPQPAGYRDAAGQHVECQLKHRILMRFPADGPNPLRVPRKADAWTAAAARAQRRNPPRTIESIEHAGYAEVCCIEMEGEEHVYLTDTTLIPTHNTGKTATTILGLLERYVAGHPVLPVIVICPNAVQDSWVHHFRWLAPRWRTVAWRGAPAKRKQLVGTADVYVVSYGTARRDAEDTNPRHNPLMALKAAYVVADEVHKVADSGSAQSQAVRRLARKAHNFIGLSGTPIRKNIDDIFPTLACLEPGAYTSGERWKNRYCLTIPGQYSAKVIGLNPPADPEFRLSLLGQYRRVAKADVLAELPPKVYTVRTVTIPEQYRKAYDQFERDMIADLPEDEDGTGGGELAVMNTLSQLAHLVALASAACDVEVTTETVQDKETGEWIEKRHVHLHPRDPSWKVDELLEILEERPGQQGVVAASSKKLIDLAGRRAAEKGLRVGYVVGGQSAKQRTAAVNAFQAGELDLMCLTTQAGGVGITLTAASWLTFLQRPWSMVDALQTEDRIHRIGSEIHESIEIIDVIAANTVETRIRAALKDKAGNLSELVRDPRIVRELLGGDQVQRRASNTRKKAA